MKSMLRTNAAAALLLLVPLGAALVAQPAAAQNFRYRVAETQGRVDNVTVSSNGGLRPGATLQVRVNATPRARWANVALSDNVHVALREQSPGHYVGTHVIRHGDRIDPARRMTVHAGWGQNPVAVAFNFPPHFQTYAMGAGPAFVGAQVDHFSIWPHPRDVRAGHEVRFRVEGTPGAQASVDVPGVVRGLALQETRPGLYVGSYTVQRRDDPRSFRDAEAMLRNGHQRTIARLNAPEVFGFGYGR